jgi:group I intron endonuclease
MRFCIPSEHAKASGIYIIRNSIHHKVYVGSTKNFYQRHKAYISGFARSKNVNSHLLNFANKHGIDTLSFELLLLCPEDELLAQEQIFVDLHKSAQSQYGFNAAPIVARNAGWKATPEQRARYSAANIKKHEDPAYLAKLSASRTGMKRPDGTGAKIAATKIGKPRRPEDCAKMSASHTGLKQSKETIAKRRAKVSGQKRTPEQLDNIRRGIAAAKAARLAVA